MTAGQVFVAACVARETITGSPARHIALALVSAFPDAALAAGGTWEIAFAVALGMRAHNRAILLAGRAGLLAMTPFLTTMTTELSATALDLASTMVRSFDFSNSK